MKALEKAGNQFDFPFADIANAFRIIKDGALPVIIRGGSFGAPPELLEEIRDNRHAGTIARKPQPFQVQVPERIRTTRVAPFTGAWIETTRYPWHHVAPFAFMPMVKIEAVVADESVEAL